VTLSIFTTIVPPTGRATLRANAGKEETARAVLKRASEKGISLVMFPAGFLRARDEKGLEKCAATVLDTASELGVATVFGIDTEAPSAKHATDRVVRQLLPFFIVAQSANDGPHFWRQRSTTSKNGGDAPVETLVRRTLRVGKTRVDVFACGEVFNQPLRNRVGPWSDRVVLVPTHTAQGARFFRAAQWSQHAGVRALLRSTHAWSPATSVGSRTSNVGQVGGAQVRRWQERG
jgi:hypothetical protein